MTDSITITSHFDYDKLSEIDGLQLTRRQIDVAACLIGRQKHKESSRILAISPSTFVEHLNNLKSALNDSQNDISKHVDLLQFLETSSKYEILKSHYIQLLVNHVFEKELQDLAKVSSDYSSYRFEIDLVDQIDRSHHLYKIFTKHIGLINTKNSKDIVKIRIYSKQECMQEMSSEAYDVFLNIEQSDNVQKDSYYLAFYDLLKKIYKEDIVIKSENDFMDKKNAYEKNLLSATLSNSYQKKDIELNTSKDPVKWISNNKVLSISLLFITVLILLLLSFNEEGADLEVENKYKFTLPPRNIKFIGRDTAFDDIKKTFSTDALGLVVKSIVGSGGIGKTQLATEYAYREYIENEYSIVLWVSAETMATINESYRDFANRLDINTDGLTGTDIINRVHDEVISEKNITKVLLVLDNAKNVEYISNILDDVYKKSLFKKAVHVLITSRDQNWDNEVLLLDIFSKEDARSFVNRYLPNANKDDVDNLIESLHYFPLALGQAVSYIKQHTNIDDFLKLYKSDKNKYLNIKAKNLGLYQNTLWRTSMLSFDKLDKNSKEILYISSYLMPDKISLDVFNYLPIENRVKAIQQLKKHSMIILLEDRQSFKIHRMLQEIVQIKIGENRQYLNALVDRVFVDFKRFNKANKNTWGDATKWLLHVAEILKALPDSMEKGALAHKAGNVARYFGLYNMAHYYFMYSLNIKKDYINPEDRETLRDLLADLGKVELYFGRYDNAKSVLESSIKINKEVQKNYNDAKLAKVLHSLGFVEQRLGHYENAKKYCEMALKIKEQYFPPDDIALAQPLHYLGVVEYGMGHYESSHQYLHKSLKIKRKHYKDDNNLDFAFSYYNLAHLERSRGNYDLARQLLEKSIQIFKANNNVGVNIAYPLFDLALINEVQGEYDKAKENIISAYNKWEHHHGKYKTTVVSHLYSPIVPWPDISPRNNDMAVEYYKEVMDYIYMLFGEEHHFTARYNYLLGLAYRIQNNPAAAKDHFIKAEKIAKKYSQKILNRDILFGHYDNIKTLELLLK